jgi:hypothetical protein
MYLIYLHIPYLLSTAHQFYVQYKCILSRLGIRASERQPAYLIVRYSVQTNYLQCFQPRSRMSFILMPIDIPSHTEISPKTIVTSIHTYNFTSILHPPNISRTGPGALCSDICNDVVLPRVARSPCATTSPTPPSLSVGAETTDSSAVLYVHLQRIFFNQLVF